MSGDAFFDGELELAWGELVSRVSRAFGCLDWLLGDPEEPPPVALLQGEVEDVRETFNDACTDFERRVERARKRQQRETSLNERTRDDDPSPADDAEKLRELKRRAGELWPQAVSGLSLVGRPPVDWKFIFEAAIAWIQKRPEDERDTALAKALREYLDRV
jgi:hypothetical protein